MYAGVVGGNVVANLLLVVSWLLVVVVDVEHVVVGLMQLLCVLCWWYQTPRSALHDLEIRAASTRARRILIYTRSSSADIASVCGEAA